MARNPLFTWKDVEAAGASEEIDAAIVRFKAAFMGVLELNASPITGADPKRMREVMVGSFSRGFVQGYLLAKQRYDLGPEEQG